MPARLHHERIARSDRSPDRWLLLSHGIYGTGSNWRGIARQVNAQRPEWGVVLVDLRHHGRSEPGAPPHTIAACADDLRALAAELGSVGALGGHSFGGKVALAARSLIAVQQTWVLDASPSARPEAMRAAEASGSVAVLELMERLPRTWPARDDFVAALEAAGQSRGLARWLAMNLVPDANGVLTLRLDLGALRALLTDFFATDLWDALADPARGDVEVVIAERSSSLSASDRARLASAPAHVHAHRIAADHWLHIEAPAEVTDLLARHLPR